VNKRCTILIIVVLAVLVLPAFGYAQSFQGGINTNVTVGSVINFTRVDNNPTTLNLTTATEIENGITVLNLSTFAIKSNVPWLVSAASATAFFSASGLYSSANMPASVLTLQVPTKTAVALSTTSKTLTSGTRGANTVSGNTFSTNITANPGFNYGPGSYSITINYTLTAQ
jgi:hypothetical protein